MSPPSVFNDRPLRLRWLRKAHEYLGLFIAPTLLMFAFTGALQLFGLHEAEDGYKPPPVIEKLAQLHIHQKYELRPQRPKAGPSAKARPAEAEKAKPPAPLGQTALKWMFLVTALGIMISTLLGLWMALTRLKNRALGIAIFLAGAILPVLMILI